MCVLIAKYMLIMQVCLLIRLYAVYSIGNGILTEIEMRILECVFKWQFIVLTFSNSVLTFTTAYSSLPHTLQLVRRACVQCIEIEPLLFAFCSTVCT